MSDETLVAKPLAPLSELDREHIVAHTTLVPVAERPGHFLDPDSGTIYSIGYDSAETGQTLVAEAHVSQADFDVFVLESKERYNALREKVITAFLLVDAVKLEEAEWQAAVEALQGASLCTNEGLDALRADVTTLQARVEALEHPPITLLDHGNTSDSGPIDTPPFVSGSGLNEQTSAEAILPVKTPNDKPKVDAKPDSKPDGRAK